MLLCDYSVIILVETWLNDSFMAGELSINGYNIHRMDRCALTSNKSRGGGVLVAIANTLSPRRLSVSCVGVVQIFVEIKFSKQNIIVGGVYMPPNSSRESYDRHCMATREVFEAHRGSNLLVFGDYNLLEATWLNDVHGLSVRCPENSPALNVAQEFAFLNLFQVNNVPNGRNTFLDICFCSLPDVKVELAQDTLLPFSLHHFAYCFEVQGRFAAAERVEEMYYDFNNANYDAINNYLASCNWDDCFSNVGVDVAVERFYLVLNVCLDFFVPKKRISHSNFPKWFSPLLKDLIFKKKVAHRQYMQTRNHNDYSTFSSIRSSCKREYNSCYRAFLTKTEQSLLNDPRYFWKHIRNLRKSNDMPNNMHLGDRESDNLRETVELFASHFSSVYEDTRCDIPEYNFGPSRFITVRSVSIAEVFAKIQCLPLKNSSGPDKITNTFLKNCVCTISKPLQLIFNKSLDTGVFPSLWKHSFVVPIFKSGCASDVSNYRGVCIQSSMAKMFDSLVYDQLSWSCKGLISEEQFGFCRGRSTTENLVVYQTALLRALERGDQVDAVYTDFSKAFDRVNFKVLIAKLRAFGFSDRLMEWLESFLVGRTQAVLLMGLLSRSFVVSSGVPQGSHCAPLLFLLFINDLTELLQHSTGILFADDYKIYKVIVNVSDSLELQADLDSLWSWTQGNNLFLNVNKCCHISFYHNRDRMPTQYTLNNAHLAYSSTVKDLGVCLDERLSFRQHISTICLKGLRTLGFVLRNCSHFSPETIRGLYTSLVRSGMEYATVIWSPYYNVYKQMVERVQHRFLRFMAFKYHMDFENYHREHMLNILNLDSLEKRRLLIDVCFIFKLIHGITDCPGLLAQISINVPNRFLRRTNLFHVHHHSTNYGMHSPIDRTLRLLNSIGGDLDIFNLSLASFKRAASRAIRYNNVV